MSHTLIQFNRVRALLAMLSEPRNPRSVSEWAGDALRFNEPKISGPFSLSARAYLREPIDLWKLDDSDGQITDLVCCMATRCGKTRIPMVGVAWRIKHDPMRCLWTKPATHGPGGARNDSKTKFIPMIRASRGLGELVPHGVERHNFTNLQQIINGSIIDWIGTGSPKQLSGNPCDVVVQDEIDGYTVKGDAEAHPCILADERTKDCNRPFRCKVSSPTLETGMIWQHLLQSDLRRRFVPCPKCGRHHPKSKQFALSWSEQYTVLPLKFPNGDKIPVAHVHWDTAARQKDGTWDLDRVLKSAHAVCPYCGHHITDADKVWMDDHGSWKPTRRGAPGVAGYHLSSLYVTHLETQFGMLAKKFLLAKFSGDGMKGFINNDLAEADITQEFARNRIEIITDEPIATPEWCRLMTVDVQQNWPYFWFTIRAWRMPEAPPAADSALRTPTSALPRLPRAGDSELICAGHCDTWSELRELQVKYEVGHGLRFSNAGVLVDCGFGAKEYAEVYRNTFSMATQFIYRNPVTKKFFPTPFPGCEAFAKDGWLPAKGFPSRKRWKDSSGVVLPWRMQINDPYKGTSEAGVYRDYIFEFAAEFFLDVLANLRAQRGGFLWAVHRGLDLTPESMKLEEYWRHMDGMFKDRETDEWKPRGRRWPDHLLDCEKMQVALASYLGIFTYDQKPPNNHAQALRPLPEP